METLAFIEGQVNEAEKERNTMICQLEEKDEEILKLRLDINLLKAKTCEATRIKEEMESSLAKENEEVFIMKSNIISLKIEAHEATRMIEEMKKKLVMKDEDYEKLKEEIVSLKMEVDLLNKNLKSSQTLDDILSHQRSSLDKSGLGYVGEPSRKNDNASNNKDVRKPGRNDTPSSSKGKSQDDIRRNPTPRRVTNDVKNTKGNEYHQIIPRKKYFRSTSRKSSSPRYQSIFLGYCYPCTNFGHMEKDCRPYHKDIYNGPRQSPRSNFARSYDFLFMNKI